MFIQLFFKISLKKLVKTTENNKKMLSKNILFSVGYQACFLVFLSTKQKTVLKNNYQIDPISL